MVRAKAKPLTTRIRDLAAHSKSGELDDRQWKREAHPAVLDREQAYAASIWGAETTDSDKFIPYFSAKSMNYSGEQLLATMPHRLGLVSRRGFKTHEQPNQDDLFILVDHGRLLFGICDGHGKEGHKVSHLVKEALPRLLMEKICAAGFSPARDWATAAREAFEEAEQVLEAELAKEAMEAGCTATVVLICPGMLLTAHVGDSLAILLGPHDQLQVLTDPHRPDRPDEMQRIIGVGGKVYVPPPGARDPARLYAGGYALANSRCLGDCFARKVGMISEPEIGDLIELEDDREHVVLVCSDGVWDMISPMQVAPLATRKAAHAQETVDRIVDKAQRRWQDREGTVDDITVICVHPCFKDSAAELRESLHIEPDPEIAGQDSLVAAFKSFDVDGNGTLSKEEVLELFQALDPHFVLEDAEKLVLAADTNGDGMIDVEEFVAWIFHDKA